jgi:predicted dehydrogenase
VTSRDLRLGVVGFGRLVRDYYLAALRALDGVRVVAVADPAPESRRAASERLPEVRIHEQHRDLITSGDLDGLLVASPPSSHLDVWRDAVAHQLAVFVEKPLVLSSQLGALDAIGEPPRLMVDFNRRFWPTYERVRNLVREGVLGAPVHVDFLLHLDVLRWSTVTRHRLDPSEGGLLHDLGCHAIDIATFVLGEGPMTIGAEAMGAEPEAQRLRLQLGFPTGSTATCDVAYGPRTRERLDVEGPKAVARLMEPNLALHVVLAGRRPNRLAAWSLDAAALGYRALRPSQRMGRATIRGALGAFVDGLRSGRDFSPGFEDGVHNARCVAAAARSLVDGRVRRLSAASN